MEVSALTNEPIRSLGCGSRSPGGTSGLGLALVRELHGRGARVAFVARTRDRVEQVARELAGVHGIVGDVSVKDDIHPVAVADRRRARRARCAGEQRLGPRPDAARVARRHRLRSPGARAGHEPARAVPADQGGPRRPGRVRPRGPRRGGAERLQRRGVNAYPSWGAYGASKAALRHLSAIWDAELAAGWRAVPRRSTPATWTRRCTRPPCPTRTAPRSKRPEAAARELADAIAAALRRGTVTGGVS